MSSLPNQTEAVSTDRFELPSRGVMATILGCSAGVVLLLVWLLYFKEPIAKYSDRFLFLPALNAAFNALSSLCLVSGYRAIRRGQRERHMRFMLSGLFFSTCFFIGYITHHHLHGDTLFQGAGLIRPIYFFILITHVALAALTLPLIPTAVYLAFSGKFVSHKRVARLALPVWLYVSVTGVVIFLMLELFRVH